MSKKVRVAINGFGRIGKAAAKIILEKHPEIELVAINDLLDIDKLLYILKFDSTYGKFEHPVKANGSNIEVKIDGEKNIIKTTQVMNPEELPWGDLDIDVVLECTGIFRNTEGAGKHLKAGAKKVIVSAPAKSPEIPTIVQGVNEEKAFKELKESGISIISNASCTTNCTAPAVKVLSDNFDIESMTGITIHAYTASQNLLDGPSKKGGRDSRAAAVNVIPTSTGAAKAVELVLPELKGKLGLTAARVPVVTGSMVYLTVNLNEDITPEEVNKKFEEAANGPMKGVLEYSTDDLVSCDIIKNTHSSIVDGQLTEMLGRTLKIVLWYDNEWGYANRLVELAPKIS